MFSVHFPKENVQHHILRSKMFSITFSKGKCSASHFVTQNVTNAFLQRIKCIFATQRVHFPKENVQHHILLHKMLQMYFGVHFPKENVQLCKNAFDAYIL